MEERQKLKVRMKSMDVGSALSYAPPPPPLPPPPTITVTDLKITKKNKNSNSNTPDNVSLNETPMDMLEVIKTKSFRLKHVNSVDKVKLLYLFSFYKTKRHWLFSVSQ